MNFDEHLWAECDDKARRMVRRTAWCVGIFGACVFVLIVVARVWGF